MMKTNIFLKGLLAAMLFLSASCGEDFLTVVPQDQLDRRLTAVLGLGEEVKLPLQILALVPGQAVEELFVGVQ